MSTDTIKGPWRKGTGIAAVIVNRDGEYLASVWGRTQQESNERTALMAAAPDLLAALKEMISEAETVVYMGVERPAVLKRARAAIAEAEGRAS